MIEGLDRFVRASEFLPMLGVCRDTLDALIRRGEFPAPDRPSRQRGSPDLWRLSTVKAGLAHFDRAPCETAQAA